MMIVLIAGNGIIASHDLPSHQAYATILRAAATLPNYPLRVAMVLPYLLLVDKSSSTLSAIGGILCTRTPTITNDVPMSKTV